MTPASPGLLADQLRKLDVAAPDYASIFVEQVLAAAQARGVSDIHLQPTAGGLLLRWRIDGVLQTVGEFPRGEAADVVMRLKVLARLLTYKSDLPQEGRLEGTQACEMRVSTFPTLHGERAVVRVFGGDQPFRQLADLALPAEIEHELSRLLAETSGVLLMTGPAGSGKTTTAYACLRHIAQQSQGRKSLVTLEDPIEAAIEGVVQSQVHPASGFDLATGLRSLMRQDPEVILVGEIRDRETAATAYQAGLTGHLVLSTFHAGSAAGSLARLIDMGIEPYLLRSGTRGVLQQRLVRRLCSCAVPATSEAELLGLSLARANVARGCPVCAHTGYRGRLVLAEQLPPLGGELGRAVLMRSDAVELHRLAVQAGMRTLLERASEAATAGQTDPAEIRRVLGFVDVAGPASG